MQTLREIRSLLSHAGLRPQKRFGQCFLVDGNLMRRLLALAGAGPGDRVLEVGPATGSLTEELLAQGARVTAVEIDRRLGRVLADRMEGREGFELIEGDVLAGKHRMAPEVLAAVAPKADLVSNLPYAIATPVVAECLRRAWWWTVRGSSPDAGAACRFGRLTFTVQQEVADRLAAGPGQADYGPISVLVGLLGRVTTGPAAPASAFWPAPKVDSRMMRIDFDPPGGRCGAPGGSGSRGAGPPDGIEDIDAVSALAAAAFTQRRKKVAALARRKDSAIEPGDWERVLSDCGVDPGARPDEVAPGQYAAFARRLGGRAIRRS